MADRLIVIVMFDQVDLLDVTGPPEVFSLLQREMDDPTGYQVVLAAESMAPVTTSAGVRILPDVTFAELGRVDTVVVPGAVEADKSAAVQRGGRSGSGRSRGAVGRGGSAGGFGVCRRTCSGGSGAARR